MIHRYATFIKAANLIVDYIVLNASLVLAWLIINKAAIANLHAGNYMPVAIVFNLLWFLCANISKLYNGVLNKDAIITYRNVFRTYLLFAGFICITIFFITGTSAYFITREFLFYTLGIFGVLIMFWKLVFLSIRKGDRHTLISKRPIAIVGAGRVGYDLYKYLAQHPDSEYKVVGFFDDEPRSQLPEDLILGPIKDCITYANRHGIREIFCTLPVTQSSTIDHLMRDADKNMIRFKLVPEYYNYANRATVVQSFGSIPVISLRPEPLESALNRALKRTFDVVFSLLVIVFVLSWLVPILTLVIKLQSKGPVFFTQWRSGLGNRQFKCYKFRSMRVNNDADKIQATRTDSRLTPVGSFLRRTNIDELPQFFNVLFGDMSVVGPRPHMLSHTEHYAKEIEKYMVRHFVKPGITGWAQVRGYRGETRQPELMEKRIEHDVWYLENWSFLLDLKIVFLTAWASLLGDERAY